jgi:hypothetical protein
MERADWFKLAEPVVIFVFVGGLLAWEWWKTRKLILLDRAQASEKAAHATRTGQSASGQIDQLTPGQDNESSQ